MNDNSKKIPPANLNIVTISLTSTGNFLISADPKTNIKNSILLEPKFQTFRPVSFSESESFQLSTPKKYSLFLGIICLKNTNFFLFCEKCVLTAQIKTHQIFEVKSIEFIAFKPIEKEKTKTPEKNAQIDVQIENLKQTIASHFSKGYYFSYTYDISKSFDKLSKQEFDFCFNYRLLNFLSLSVETKPWMIPIVQGFAKSIDINLNPNKRIKYTLIARLIQNEQCTFFEISVFIEIDRYLTIRKCYVGDISSEYLIHFFEKMFKMSKCLVILNLIDNINPSNSQKIIEIEELIKPAVESNKFLKYQFIKKSQNINLETTDLLNLEENFSNYTKVFEDFEFTNFNPFDFRVREQKGFLLMLFSDILSSQICLFLFYSTFIGTRKILKNIDTSYERLTVKMFDEIAKDDFTKLYSKMFDTFFLLLNDSKDNAFSKTLIKIKTFQSKNGEFLIDLDDRLSPSNPIHADSAVNKKAEMYFGSPIKNQDLSFDINLLEMDSNLIKKLGSDKKGLGSFNLIDMDSKEHRTDQRPARSRSQNRSGLKDVYNNINSPQNIGFVQKQDNLTPTPRYNNNLQGKDELGFNRRSIHEKKDFYRNKKIFIKTLQNPKCQIQLDQKSLSGFRIFLMTWNLSGLSPEALKSKLRPIFAKIQKYNPDIVYFGFQELVELKMKFKSMMSLLNVDKIIRDWKLIFAENLSNYKIYFDENIIGLQSFLLVRSSSNNAVLSIDPQLIKLGMMNIGNKGAIKLVMNFNGYLIEISNCHLSAGQNEESYQGRLKDLQAIFAKNVETIEGSRINCGFLLGDFNFKVRNNIPEVLQILKSAKDPYKMLQNFDELTDACRILPEINHFREEKVCFPPTYKYFMGESEFDTSSDRTPSWCDRIIYSSNRLQSFKIIDYFAIPLHVSDHLPVYIVADVNIQTSQTKN